MQQLVIYLSVAIAILLVIMIFLALKRRHNRKVRKERIHKLAEKISSAQQKLAKNNPSAAKLLDLYKNSMNTFSNTNINEPLNNA